MQPAEAYIDLDKVYPHNVLHQHVWCNWYLNICWKLSGILSTSAKSVLDNDSETVFPQLLGW